MFMGVERKRYQSVAVDIGPPARFCHFCLDVMVSKWKTHSLRDRRLFILFYSLTVCCQYVRVRTSNSKRSTAVFPSFSLHRRRRLLQGQNVWLVGCLQIHMSSQIQRFRRSHVCPAQSRFLKDIVVLLLSSFVILGLLGEAKAVL